MAIVTENWGGRQSFSIDETQKMSYFKNMTHFTTTLGPNGRIVIPAKARKQLKLKSGTVLHIILQDDHLVVQDYYAPWQALQEHLRPYWTKPGAPLASDELIAERRAEAKREALEE